MSNKSNILLVDNVAVLGNGTQSASKSAAKTGYTAIGVLGLSASGAVQGVQALYDWKVVSNTAYCYWTQTISSGVGVTMRVLYVKTD